MTSSFPGGLSDAALEYELSPSHYLGPILVASLMDSMLFGVLIVRFFRDTAKFRILVIFLLIINIAQTGLVFYTVYSIFGERFGDWEAALTNVYFEGVMILEAMAGSLSQAFFLERAFSLLRRNRILGWVLLAFCIPSILAGLGMGIACGATTVLQATVSTDFDKFKLLADMIIAWKSVTVFTDIILTTTIICCLLCCRTGRNSTDSMVEMLISWIVEAQTLPLVVALFFLASYAVDPGANLCIVPSFMEGKVCALSVLHLLNSRGRFRHQVSSSSDSSKLTPPEISTPKDTIIVSTVTHTRYSIAPDINLPTDLDLESGISGLEKTESLGSQNLESIAEFDPPSWRVRSPTPPPHVAASSYPPPRRQLDIDMVDPRRRPIGPIRTHSMERPVIPFEEMRW